MTTPAIAGSTRRRSPIRGVPIRCTWAGAGPAVIVIHEIPGIHPGMVSFAQRLLQAGYTGYLPSLFGRLGQPVSTGAVLRSILQVCGPRIRDPGRPD